MSHSLRQCPARRYPRLAVKLSQRTFAAEDAKVAEEDTK